MELAITNDSDKFDCDALIRLRRNLRRWYERHRRDLPWRGVGDPYRVWLSEVMLQQTTVAAVAPYYERFLARFPTVADLAAADEADVLRLWEGLGYYSRARNLHRTAQVIADEHGGRFPRDPAELQNLPGVGRYTAGAIASFAFDRPAAIVEANTIRLYCRLLGYRGDPRSTAGQRRLWEFAERLVPKRSPGRFNQALLDLGATVCTPADPDCQACPLRRCCRAFEEGSQAEIPAPPRRPNVTEIVEAAVVVESGNRYLLRRIPAGRRWAGLWDFPRFAIDGGRASPELSGRRPDPAPPSLEPDAYRPLLEDAVRQEYAIEANVAPREFELRHSVTRYRIRLWCYPAQCDSDAVRTSDAVKWLRTDEFEDVALSTTGRKIAKRLESTSGDSVHKSAT